MDAGNGSVNEQMCSATLWLNGAQASGNRDRAVHGAIASRRYGSHHQWTEGDLGEAIDCCFNHWPDQRPCRARQLLHTHDRSGISMAAKLPRFKEHVTLISASRLDLVEHFFAVITRKRIRRGTFITVAGQAVATHDDINRQKAPLVLFVFTPRVARTSRTAQNLELE
jgi:hypothetical protein